MKKGYFLFTSILALVLLQSGCAVPHKIMPHKDVTAREVNDPSLDKRVLLASRSSEFKDEIVQRIEDAFHNENVYVKIIGLDELALEDSNEYSAVVLINESMAWGKDPKVKAFLKQHEETGHVIVLTTSNSGGWLPNKKEHDFDAISSASKSTDVDAVANEIADKVRVLLDQR